MILRELAAYAERLEDRGDLPPRMYQGQPLKWLIELDHDGAFQGFVSTVAEGAKGREKRGKEFLAPFIKRTSSVRAQLLADRAGYALGLADQEHQSPKELGRIAEAHAAFVGLVDRCAAQSDEPTVEAVRLFLSGLDLASLPVPEGVQSGDGVTFLVEGVLPIDLPLVRRWWAETFEHSADPQSLRTCLVCGKPRMPAKRHPVPIKGIPGGQSSGMQIVSANENAFESYGLQASLIAPVCHPCAEHYAQAANALLGDAQTHLRVGPAQFLFWTKGDNGFSPATLLSQPSPEEVRELLASVYSGRHAQPFADDTFFVAALSASGGRVAVRGWSATTVGQARRALARFFRLQDLVDPKGQPGRPLGVFALAASLVREAKDLQAHTLEAMVRCALNGDRLQNSILAQALGRTRAGGSAQNPVVSRQRAAIIKLVLASQIPEQEGDRMRQLDLENQSAAYLCGRLLATLERIQYLAVHPKATLVDRFYGSASSAPMAVYPSLLRTSQSHLGKLRKASPGLHRALQAQLEEILSGISEFPRVLTLNEQGLFALGYYHQRAEDRRRASAGKADKDKSESDDNLEPTDDQAEVQA